MNSKEEIARKFGWVHKPRAQGSEYMVWETPNGSVYKDVNLLDWENSLDLLERDIFPYLRDNLGLKFIQLDYELGIPRCKFRFIANPTKVHTGKTLAQACWKAVLEVLG